jgi:hypothetical protein
MPVGAPNWLLNGRFALSVMSGEAVGLSAEICRSGTVISDNNPLKASIRCSFVRPMAGRQVGSELLFDTVIEFSGEGCFGFTQLLLF